MILENLQNCENCNFSSFNFQFISSQNKCLEKKQFFQANSEQVVEVK